ncbi:hypothetical protein V1477_008047 [Vespula maculifrons]|uniref:Uncharacterized protein n=1 Tax=Vespula maculifrons TaxID=7453 RepID=A0ABD2CGD3_VESMC
MQCPIKKIKILIDLKKSPDNVRAQSFVYHLAYFVCEVFMISSLLSQMDLLRFESISSSSYFDINVLHVRFTTDRLTSFFIDPRHGGVFRSH